jgi:Zn-dependent protease
MKLGQGTIRLFRFAEVEVFLHWSWFLVAAFEINGRANSYSSFTWNALEYLGLFIIVLMHEYGHALACRQVGGNSSRIVLWPMGGVAFVDPPPRAGANLWSIAAGPLVNVVLVPVFLVIGLGFRSIGLKESVPDLYALLRALSYVNIGLLAFNLLPIYPLDGGQILRSLLWFIAGRGRSLMIATVFGFVGVAGLAAIAVYAQSLWIGIIAVFVLMNCWNGLQQARVLMRIAKLPRRHEYACPSCHTSPPIGEFWKCGACTNPFDTFLTQAKCPICSAQFSSTTCMDCHKPSPFSAWFTGSSMATNA